MRYLCSLPAAALLFFAAACDESVEEPAPPGLAITRVSVQPDHITLFPYERFRFVAEVEGIGAFDPSVGWQCQFGWVHGDGQYIAPSYFMHSSNDTVTAVSLADPTKFDKAAVHVVVLPLSVPLDSLRQAPTEIEIDGRTYFLDPLVYRDESPVDGASWGLLGVTVFVTASDSLDVPSSLDADLIWVVNDEEVWEADLFPRDDPRPYRFRRDAPPGPRWEEGDCVDVIVRIISPDRTSLVSARDQVIWVLS